MRKENRFWKASPSKQSRAPFSISVLRQSFRDKQTNKQTTKQEDETRNWNKRLNDGTLAKSRVAKRFWHRPQLQHNAKVSLCCCCLCLDFRFWASFGRERREAARWHCQTPSLITHQRFSLASPTVAHIRTEGWREGFTAPHPCDQGITLGVRGLGTSPYIIEDQYYSSRCSASIF